MILDEATYLEHYGVKGMQWGVRKERKAVEKQAKIAKKVARYEKALEDYDKAIWSATSQSRIAKSKLAKRVADSQVKELTKQRAKVAEGLEYVKQGKGDPHVRKAIILTGAAVTAYGLASYAQARPEQTARAVNFIKTRGKATLISMATAAGKAHRRMGESEVQRFLRQNAAAPGRGQIIDVYSRAANETFKFAGALTR